MSLKRLLTFAIALGIMLAPNQADAYQKRYDLGGIGYQNSWTLPSLTPYIALGTVAAVAIAVMAIRHHHHSHN